MKWFVQFWDMFVVRLEWSKRQRPAPSSHCSFSSWGCVILGCIHVWLGQLQYSSWTSWSLKFRNRTFLISWRCFLQGFVVRPWLRFQYLHHMKPQRERHDCAGLDRIGGFFLFSNSWERTTAFGFRWMLDGASRFVIRTSRMQSVYCFQKVSGIRVPY